ncbi:FUSC family protein [Haloferula rosea]|uniref:FUSC family protein n=1 Tax=Haloferula rosea TaxID=490093 RepID=A0A934R9F8_9BACT|nr:FUSC family protein [Haloferula rosea]MBK1825643.1 FUSC family protein [Haloferula rosea]
MIKRLKESFDFSKRQLRDATRLALQAAAAASSTFLIMQALGMAEEFVGILSAVLVLSPGIGGTITSAWKRLAATIIGAAVGALCFWIIPGGYGTALALSISMLVMNGITGLFPQWRYGVVAAVALALGSEDDVMATALDRSLSIALGVVVGIVVSIGVWPSKSSARSKSFIREALSLTAERLELALSHTSKDVTDEASKALADLENRYSSLISHARSEASNVNVADNERLLERLDAADRIDHSVRLIHRVATEEDQIEHEGNKMVQTLEEVGQSMQQILRGTSSDEQDEERPSMRALHDRIEELRGVTGGDESKDDWHHVNRVVLVFALDEIVEAMEILGRSAESGSSGG